MTMKSTIVCILLATSLGTSLAQAVSACSTSAGVNSEAFSWLSRAGQDVQIYPTPSQNVTADICNGLFLSQGTCCETNSLKSKIFRVNTDIAKRWQQYIGTLGRFRNVIMKALKKLAPYINQQLIEGKIAQLNAVGASTKLVDILPLIPRDEESLKKVVAAINGFEDSFMVYKEKAKGCFETLKASRSNVYCAMCAGNNKDYAKPQTPYEFIYKVDQDSCKALLGSCFDTWKFNFNVLTMAQLITVLKMKSKGTDATTSFLSQNFMNNDAVFEFRKAMDACEIKDNQIACSADLDVNIRKLCTLGFASNKHNGYVEGDASYISDIQADDQLESLVETETRTLVTKRLLAGTVEPTITIDIEDRDTNYPNLTRTDTGIISSEGTIDLKDVGESAKPLSGMMFRLAVSVMAMLFALLGLH